MPFLALEKIIDISPVASPDKLAARTIVGIGKDRKMIIFIAQLGRKKDNPKTPYIHRAGIGLYSAATWILGNYPAITDIIALDGSGSTQAAVNTSTAVHPEQFYKFTDNDGDSVIVTSPGDIVNKVDRYRPIQAH